MIVYLLREAKPGEPWWTYPPTDLPGGGLAARWWRVNRGYSRIQRFTCSDCYPNGLGPLALYGRPFVLVAYDTVPWPDYYGMTELDVLFQLIPRFT